MKERSVILQAEQVLATLKGRKRKIHIPVKIEPPLHCHYEMNGNRDKALCLADQDAPNVPKHPWFVPPDPRKSDTFLKCPAGRPGDRVWVKETWADVHYIDGPSIAYRADGEVRSWREFSTVFGPDYGVGPSMNYEAYPGNYFMWADDLFSGVPEHGWRPSGHMPRWASRIVFRITDIQVHLVKDISEEAAKAEGISLGGYDPDGSPDEPLPSYRAVFRQMWKARHARSPWDTAWCWDLTVERET